MKNTKKRKKIGKVQRKILSLLLAGVALGLSRSPRTQKKILKEIPKEMERINLMSLEYGLHRLYEEKYIGLKDCGNNLYIPYLTKEGKQTARIFSIEEKIMPKLSKWDGKWRIVMFDIPEKYKKQRNDFRRVLLDAGFSEYQKSVLCFPYPCGNEVMSIADFLHLALFVQYSVAEELSNDQILKRHFNLA